MYYPSLRYSSWSSRHGHSITQMSSCSPPHSEYYLMILSSNSNYSNGSAARAAAASPAASARLAALIALICSSVSGERWRSENMVEILGSGTASTTAGGPSGGGTAGATTGGPGSCWRAAGSTMAGITRRCSCKQWETSRLRICPEASTTSCSRGQVLACISPSAGLATCRETRPLQALTSTVASSACSSVMAMEAIVLQPSAREGGAKSVTRRKGALRC